MKVLPFILAGGVVAAVAALAPLGGPDPAAEFARKFVECSDVKGPAACESYLDEWSKRPKARQEIIDRFAKDQAFALHLLAFGDAQITTGSVRK